MADDPVEEAEAGTAEEEAEESAAETEEAVATEESQDEAADDAEGEDSDAEDAAPKKGTVKYSRFRNVNERRKAAEAKAAALESQLAALRPKTEQPKPKGLRDRLKQDFVPAPSDMNPLEQMQFYGLQAAEKHLPELIEAWFEEKFGTKPEAAAATLAHSKESAQATIRRDFEVAAKEHGFDPTNRAIQVAVGGLMDSGVAKTFGEAMSALKPKAQKVEAKRVNGKGAETDNVDVTGLTRASKILLNKDEAMALAAKGVRAPQVSIVDILRAKG